MKYVGSKGRLWKNIYPLIEPHLTENYIEPFVGGANFIDKVKAKNKVGSDSNKYVIALLEFLKQGNVPKLISKDEYKEIRSNPENYEPHVVGWAGICCSYSGKWFGGYAGVVNTKQGQRNYQQEALNNVLQQAPNLKDTTFINCSYLDLEIPENSLIYCDPPYRGTLQYADQFDSDQFWEWASIQSRKGHLVFVSEYSAPNDWVCIYEKGLSSSLSANGVIGGSKKSVERLFIHKNHFSIISQK